ncbi:hypothetical protein [Halalkalibacterium ligniniphilum]|uniref:hypothetical protein n=1 Tax=Halalkalibacterium ligniniphilum TaxID=1134413 RepID=UPI000344B47E|nr:hypothetical protein [Halalkalibacterium ligniniphilum]
MRNQRAFQAGDVVRIINPNNLLYGEVSIIDSQKENYYILNLSNGKKITCYHQDIVSCLSYKEYKKLLKAHLIQLQILAVDLGDKKWFEELGEIYDKFQLYDVQKEIFNEHNLGENMEGEIR